MGLIDLRRERAERLAPEIAEELRAVGAARRDLDEVGDVECWRQAARRAGRQLGWHVRTGSNPSGVWATSEDYEPAPGSDRQAAERTGAIIFESPRVSRGPRLELLRLEPGAAQD